MIPVMMNLFLMTAAKVTRNLPTPSSLDNLKKNVGSEFPLRSPTGCGLD